jgi:hypothetical protein
VNLRPRRLGRELQRGAPVHHPSGPEQGKQVRDVVVAEDELAVEAALVTGELAEDPLVGGGQPGPAGEEALHRQRPAVLPVAAPDVEEPGAPRRARVGRGEPVDERGRTGGGDAEPRLELGQRREGDDVGRPPLLHRTRRPEALGAVGVGQRHRVLAVRTVLTPRGAAAPRPHPPLRGEADLHLVDLARAPGHLALAQTVLVIRPALHPPLAPYVPALLEGGGLDLDAERVDQRVGAARRG